ncbi:MAG: hypothetical protein PF495_09280, partial [Spirochaetales bacterium]|nr:hypothetical protein [Spirochaetales bacterium]
LALGGLFVHRRNHTRPAQGGGGVLGVGFDAEDGHIRITQAEKYDVLMGSHESHEYIVQLIEKIEQELEHRGLLLDELSPDQLTAIISEVRAK